MEMIESMQSATGRVPAVLAAFATTIGVTAAAVLLATKGRYDGGLFFLPYSVLGGCFGAILGAVGWWDARGSSRWPRTLGRASFAISLAMLAFWAVLLAYLN